MPMTFDEYSQQADTTAVYPDRGQNMAYAVLGLAGEAGECAEKLKKLIRDRGGEVDDQFVNDMRKELGDVLWYINAACFELGIPLEEVAAANLHKLFSRKERGVLQGSGDNR